MGGQTQPTQGSSAGGYSLAEMLMALSAGLLVSVALIEGLMHEVQGSTRLQNAWRQRHWQQRVLNLVRDDLESSETVSSEPEQEAYACNLNGRTAVLHMSGRNGSTTYSVGPAPSPIWRGPVLMRCGKAFDLNGSVTTTNSPAQNRVLIDGLRDSEAELDPCNGATASGANMPNAHRLRATGWSACIAGSLLLVRLSSGTAGQPTTESRLAADAHD